MAEVPYTPYPTAQPSGAGQSIHVSTPGAAFGEDIAQAVSHLGQVGEQATNEIWNRALALQDLRNQADSRDAVTRYVLQTNEMQAKFDSAEGSNAGPEALKAHTKQLADLREQIQGSLKTPMAQKYFAQESQGWFLRNSFNAASHAATETKKYVVNGMTANLNAIRGNIYAHPGDNNAFHEAIDKGDDYAVQKGHVFGLSPEGVEDLKRKERSATFAALIRGVMKTDPIQAMKLLNAPENADMPYDKDRLILTNEVRQQTRTIGARIMGDKIFDEAGGKDPRKTMTSSVAEMEKKADEAAAKQDPNDPELPALTRQEIRKRFGEREFVTKTEDNNNMTTIYQAMKAGITSVEQLKSTPEGLAAYNHLPEKKQLQVDAAIEHYAHAQQQISNEKEWRRLTSLAHEDPQKFLKEDILGNKSLSRSGVDHFMAQRDKIEKGGEGDPAINRTLMIMAPKLLATGLDKRNDPEGYSQFLGTLIDDLHAEQQAKGKPLTYEEQKKVGDNVLKNFYTDKGWFGSGVGRGVTPFYQMQPPSEDLEKLRTAIQGDHPDMPPPSEADVVREWRRQQYMKLYGLGKERVSPTQ